MDVHQQSRPARNPLEDLQGLLALFHTRRRRARFSQPVGRTGPDGRLVRLLGGSASPVTAYVVNSGSGTVTPIRTATNTAGTAITVGRGPFAIAITQ